MAEFLDKSIEKLGKQKEKGEKKLEKEKKKVEKAENQNSILQERITGKGVHQFGSEIEIDSRRRQKCQKMVPRKFKNVRKMLCNI